MSDSRLLGRTESSLFTIISFATLFILLTSSIFCNIFLHSTILRTIGSTRIFITYEGYPQFILNSSPSPLLSMEEGIKEIYDKDPDPLIPPINVTEEERIDWFKKKLPEIEILQSTALTKHFAKRAQKLFTSGCEVRFFMTWISPAKSFSRRELFSLESIFKAHPYGCLMILSETMDSRQGDWILKPLFERGFRVLALKPDLPFLFKDTPAETWFDELKKGNKDPGEIPLPQNLSNLLRLAVVYKYGGIYLDTDFIVLKKLSGLKNSIAAQSMDVESKNWTRLNNAVLIFDKNHPLLFKFIQEFSLTFDGNKWGHNGPYLVSRVVQRVMKRPGYNFTVLPPMDFYPVYWNKIGSFFRRPKNLNESRWIEEKLLQLSNETYAVHLKSGQEELEGEPAILHLVAYTLNESR